MYISKKQAQAIIDHANPAADDNHPGLRVEPLGHGLISLTQSGYGVIILTLKGKEVDHH